MIDKTLYIRYRNVCAAFRCLPACVFLTLTLCTSCIEEEIPTTQASAGQVASSSESLNMLVGGLKSKMISYCNYYSDASSWYATQDWGYGCYMLTKEALLDGFPSTGTTWNYQYYYETGTRLTSYTAPAYFYYYNLADLSNKILRLTTDVTDSKALHYRGTAYAYRALAYMDLAMMFEFWPTGNAAVDSKAADVWGLTVPIVTENTTQEEAKSNPRADFVSMYHFIYSDLCKAGDLLIGFERQEKNDVNIDVVNGLMARFWIMLGARFDRYPADLQKLLDAEKQMGDGDHDHAMEKKLGIATASDCYQRAYDAAGAVIAAGYEPLSKDQWHDVKTGFNSANQAWVWDMRLTSKEQYSTYWNTITGNLASEPTWALPAYGGEYRCISSDLYSMIQDGDWRKTSWVAPEDAGAAVVPAKYSTQLKNETSATKEANTCFSRLPAYANLKFRPAMGSMDDEQTGVLCDIPLMRIEEMHFIQIEAMLMLHGLEKATDMLEEFMSCRMDDGKKYVSVSDYKQLALEEIIAQKYIELWGEGILYNDYKRLGLPIVRNSEKSNYIDPYNKLNHMGDGCAQWLNFYIPEVARTYNAALSGKMNPDPTPSE